MTESKTGILTHALALVYIRVYGVRLGRANLSGCRLPLSRLLFWSELDRGRADGYVRMGSQENVFFETLAWAPGGHWTCRPRRR